MELGKVSEELREGEISEIIRETEIGRGCSKAFLLCIRQLDM